MATSFMEFNPARLRSYVFRLPLATRLIAFISVGLFIASIPLPWLHELCVLRPSKVGITSMHRLNSYGFMHNSVLHLLINTISIVPYLERFEAEFGTIVTVALFTGPFGLLPGVIYVVVERFILRVDVAVAGSSIWFFLLLSAEFIKIYRANPHFAIGPYKIPTWATPLFLILVVSFLSSSVSLIGHLSGAAIGYLWGLGYIRFLAPPEWALRWIEGKLNLLGRLPHYVSVDQKTYGRYGVLPSSGPGPRVEGVLRPTGPGQRLGP